MVRTTPTKRTQRARRSLHGMKAARGKFFCVMDADLQHPPEKLPELLAPLRSGEADFVLGSRYMPGGSTEAEWGVFRKMNSQFATLLARPFAGRTTDPMAGFFALKRETYESAQNLTPLGYKIALELMCKCHLAKNVREIPIHFGMRLKGESKLSAQAAIPISRAFEPSLRFRLPTRLADDEIPDRDRRKSWIVGLK